MQQRHPHTTLPPAEAGQELLLENATLGKPFPHTHLKRRSKEGYSHPRRRGAQRPAQACQCAAWQRERRKVEEKGEREGTAAGYPRSSPSAPAPARARARAPTLCRPAHKPGKGHGLHARVAATIHHLNANGLASEAGLHILRELCHIVPHLLGGACVWGGGKNKGAPV